LFLMELHQHPKLLRNLSSLLNALLQNLKRRWKLTTKHCL
jgi:hypothetical protein